MKITLNGKEYTVKFGYEATVKSGLLKKVAQLQMAEDGLDAIEKILSFLPEFLLIGLQKYHSDEFGFDLDNEDEKQKQVSKMFCILDDYFDNDNENGGDIKTTFQSLEGELEKNSFLSKLLEQEQSNAKKTTTRKG